MKNETPYAHRVQYYETDQMGIAHHSNYIRWFEEARTDYLRRNEIVYHALEQAGIMIPVVRVSSRYIRPARYDDVLHIETTLTGYNGVRLALAYHVRNGASGMLLAEGQSEHCFMDASRWRPVNLKKTQPEFSAKLERLLDR